MILAFELLMPSNNAWNGRWSGEGRCYAILKTFRGKKQEAKAAELCAKRSYYYSFGDGWGAAVGVREVDASEARRLRKNSAGFCGYDWMVRTIFDYGEIMNDLQVREYHEQKQQAAEAIAACEGAARGM